MDHPPVSLKELLLRPLWTESESYRAWRRCRLAITLPSAGLAGAIWGVVSAAGLGVGNAFAWSVLCALAFTLLMYVEERLLPVALEGGRQLGLGAVGGHLWQLGFVGSIAFLVVNLLGAPIVPALTTATVIAGTYTWAMNRVFCGGMASRLAEFFVPVNRAGVPPPPDHSFAASLAARGEHDAAIETYRLAIDRDPQDPVPYLRLARLLNWELRRPEDALGFLRQALSDARLSPEERRHAVRLIFEICRESLGAPEAAAKDLAAFAESGTDPDGARWARNLLEEIGRGEWTPSSTEREGREGETPSDS